MGRLIYQVSGRLSSKMIPILISRIVLKRFRRSFPESFSIDETGAEVERVGDGQPAGVRRVAVRRLERDLRVRLEGEPRLEDVDVLRGIGAAPRGDRHAEPRLDLP